MSLPENTKLKNEFADIIVDISHESLDRVFQYRVPSSLQGRVVPGIRVCVPFGASNREIEGYVIALKDRPDYDPDKIKEVQKLAAGSISVESQLIKVADFLRKQYGSTMIQALKTVLPVKQKVRHKTKTSVLLRLSPDQAQELLKEWERKHYTARVRLLCRLLQEHSLDSQVAVKACGVPLRELKKLEGQGILELSIAVAWRTGAGSAFYDKYNFSDSAAYGVNSGAASGTPVRLNREQQSIADQFRSDYEAGVRKNYLLYGVTGSGKTEVYLSLIETVLKAGKQAIVLIPEISLTFQTVKRFSERFGRRIAVLHSRMSAGERSDEVERINKGEAKVVIGARSALFAPVCRLGIIIIDEEHDGAYKSDSSPKYHARETAVFRAGLSGASVVLGSATPSVESFARAKDGEYTLWTLKSRAGAGRLPEIRIVDLREEFSSGNRSIFSRKLKALMADRLEKKEQTMLFLNRRGFAGFVSCRSCGQVVKCPHCDVSLTYHRNGSLRCHYCGYETRYDRMCPSCGRPHVAAFGLGTEKVEAALYQEFPGARILRMDADTTRKKHAHEEILRAFAKGEADILLGTQMIVKGHDYANVTLVGILAADLSLNSSDYRSGEKTFQLLCQAAGRAGRGEKAGDVVIQTYSPEHYAVTSALHHSYEEFFEQEYSYRKLMCYPPCAHFLVILIQSGDEEQAVVASHRIQRMIIQSQNNTKDTPVILNPGRAAVAKLKDVYRQVLYLKHPDEELLHNIRLRLEPVLEKHPMFAGISVQFDFDPMNRY